MKACIRLVIALAAGAAAAAPFGSAVAAETFTYDALGRLLTARSDTPATRTFVYDRADNVLQILIS